MAAVNPAYQAMKAVVTRTDRLWPNHAQLHYAFLDRAPLTVYQQNQQSKVTRVVLEWSNYANISFAVTDNLAASNIRITFKPYDGSWSYVGNEVSKIDVSKATMNLGWVSGDNDAISADERAVILHEFGHTLGLMHEHQSPLRGNNITLKESAVLQFYERTQGWSEQEVRDQILSVYNDQELSNYSDIDLKSIMMYFMPAEMNNEGIEVKPNNELSALDKAFMTINYPFFDESDTKNDIPGLQLFKNALDVAGVDGDPKTTLMDLYRGQSINEIRFEFTRWCIDIRAAREKPPSFAAKPGDDEVINSDIIACRTEDFFGAGSTAASRAVATRYSDLWTPGATITYAWEQGNAIATPHRKDIIENVFVAYQERGNIRFQWVPKNEQAMVRIYFQVDDDPTSASWSRIGAEVRSPIDAPGAPPQTGLFFNRFQVLEEVSQSLYHQTVEQHTVFHEIGHILGLRHEHTSPYTETTNTPSDAAKMWIATQWDPKSVMLYPCQALKKLPGMTGINPEPSGLDYAFLGAIYPYPRGHICDNLEHDITVLGLQASSDNLLRLRDDAFSVEGTHQFSDCLDAYRQALFNALTGVVAARSAAEPVDDGIGRCGAEDVYPGYDSEGTGALRAVATKSDELWTPQQTITIMWDQDGKNYPSQHRRDLVEAVFRDYEARVNLHFDWVPTNYADSALVCIYFQQTATPNLRSWSKIAKRKLTPEQRTDPTCRGTVDTTLWFSATDVPAEGFTNQDDKDDERSVVYHEIGHTLGLIHEQNSPYTKTTDKPEEAAKIWTATLWDPKSIMLYPNRKLKTSSFWDEIKYIFGFHATGPNKLPSDIDYALLGAAYPYSPRSEKDALRQNLATLGLGASANDLLGLRDLAFGEALDTDEFRNRIEYYRQRFNSALSSVIAARASAIIAAQSAARDQPAHAVIPSSVIPPSNFALARDVLADIPSKASKGSFLDELLTTLSSFFKPTTGQIFALQFPGRFLQEDLYAWDTNKAGIYGQFIKPTVVNESEFRLVDQLYTIGPVIGAPSGINLSIVYEEVLNNLVPRVEDSLMNFTKQQGQIREWLLADVPTAGWVKDLIAAQNSKATAGTSSSDAPSGVAHALNAASSSVSFVDSDTKPQFSVANKLSDDNKVNRMELAEAFMHEYLEAKQAWELERDEMIKNTKHEDLDALTRRLAHITAIRESQLASKYADAVVRGYSHVIRQYMGYMDIKTPAECLQDAKDALRESAMSSMDGSMKVYPVQMSPVDWFQSLSTSFTMEDLTADKDAIAQQLQIKSKELDDLNARIAILQCNPKKSVQELQTELQGLQTAYDNAVFDLNSTYTSNVVALARACINANNEFVMTDFVPAARNAKILDAAFDKIEKSMKALTDAQLAVTKTTRALTQVMAAKSLAEASDTSQEIVETNVKIAALTKDISELTTRLQSLQYHPTPPSTDIDPTKTSDPNSIQSVDVYPPEKTSSGGSRWQDIYMKHSVDTKYNSASEASKASLSDMNVSLFFGSYHSESSETSAETKTSSLAASVDVEVGFRATLVTVDRGGWFQPQFFKQSTDFYHLDPNITWSRWPQGIEHFSDLSNNSDTTVWDDLNKCVLPAYPAGFIICKDITVKIHITSTDIKAAGAEIEKYAATSAGILCFSMNKSEHSKASDKSYSFVQKGDGCIIRIPGPQILGYILQFTDNDKTELIPVKLPDGFLLSDADYNSSFKEKAAQSDANPASKSNA
ncbi:hypothetical protein BDZ97DRAFT_154780 [Flammula alnicola]|nr:hypothetical protein BDZ97DRAFT_154780 [Flammula alnicola]